MKQSFLLLMLLCGWMVCMPLSAQHNDSIRAEIMSLPHTDLEVISKGRALILEHLTSGNLGALKEVKDYLAGELYNPYRVFTPVEYWLLSYWTEDFVELLHEATVFSANVDPRSSGYWMMPDRFRSTPMLQMIMESDRLWEELGKKSAEAYIPLTVSIDHAELNDEEKEFLKLWLYSLLFTPDKVDNELEMEEVNTRATAFLDQFQESDYADYTRRFIRYRFRPSNWGLGYDFYLGYNMFTGGLSDHFANRATFGFAFEILYKEITASVRFNYSGTETRQAITHRGITWPQGIKGYAVGADLAFQYPVLQNQKIKLSPFVGIGGMGIGPNETELDEFPELEDFKELSSFNYLAGVDFKLNAWNKEVDLSRHGGGYVGLRYTYYFPNYHNRYELLNGNMHMITLTVGSFVRPMKRDY